MNRIVTPSGTGAHRPSSGRRGSVGDKLSCLIALVACGVLLPSVSDGQAVASSKDWDTFSDTWVATDALGRGVPSAGERGSPRGGRFCGLFYFYGPPKAFHSWGEPLPIGGVWFVDAYSQEFRRDIELMQGGHGDNYYYQLAGNVRRFKVARALPPVTSQPVQEDGRFDDPDQDAEGIGLHRPDHETG